MERQKRERLWAPPESTNQTQIEEPVGPIYALGNSENSCGRKTFGRAADVRVLLEKGFHSKGVEEGVVSRL